MALPFGVSLRGGDAPALAHSILSVSFDSAAAVKPVARPRDANAAPHSLGRPNTRSAMMFL